MISTQRHEIILTRRGHTITQLATCGYLACCSLALISSRALYIAAN